MNVSAAQAAGGTDYVAGMIEGIWIAPGHEAPAEPPYVHPVSAVLPQPDFDPDQDDEFLCLDLVQIATGDQPDSWAWMVLSEAGTYTYGHTIGLNRGESWRFVRWVGGEQRVYEASYTDDWLPPEEIEKLYGSAAFARARPDRNAVQLRLRRVR